jgi:hypothetical protein
LLNFILFNINEILPAVNRDVGEVLLLLELILEARKRNLLVTTSRLFGGGLGHRKVAEVVLLHVVKDNLTSGGDVLGGVAKLMSP